MNIRYKFRGLPPRSVAERPLDGSLEALGQFIPISTANVLLEHQPNAAPAFCISVELAVPGPDIHAAARDHTLEAAILKVMRRLEEQIQGRQSRQQRRRKRREPCRGGARQWSGNG